MKRPIIFGVMGMLLLVAAVTWTINPNLILRLHAGEKPTVAVSIAPQATFVREIAGDLVNVVTMLPPGANHETYSPPPQDMILLSESKVFFAVGLPNEKANMIPRAAELNRDLRIIDMQDEVAKFFPPRFFAPNDRDPHIWLSPKRAIAMVKLMTAEIAAIDPANRPGFEASAARYIARIEDADRQIKDSFKQMSNMTFIVYHPAFGYFADDYGLMMVALEEEGKEADPRRLREVIDMAREKGIKIIFYQEDIDSRQSRTLAEELGGRAEKVAPMAADYVENLLRMANTFAGGLK